MVWTEGTLLNNGKYQIVKEVGQGGFGITYEAVLVETGGKVVIKAPLSNHLSKDKEYPKYLKQFRKEARSLERLPNDRHLVRIRDIFDEPQVFHHDQSQAPREVMIPCMVMNFIEGKTLYDLIQEKGAIEEEQAIGWISAVAGVLVKVHESGLVHQDIHAANIIINPEGQPVIIDFGIAHDIQPLSKTTVCMGGHPTFAPFEQINELNKGKAADPRIDIYTLAATLYYAVTGQEPIAPNAIFISKSKLIEPKKIKAAITAGTNRAVMSGMSFYPDDRPATMQEWLEILMGDRRPKRFTRRKVLQYGGLAVGSFGLALVGDRAYTALSPGPVFLPGPTPPKLSQLILKEQSFKTVLLNDVGKIESKPEKMACYYQEDLGNDIVLTMILIPGGTFQMGSPKEELDRSEDETLHEVEVPDFLMGEVQVTQAQWRTVATQLPEIRLSLKPTPSYFTKDGSDRPVERVNWFEALEFCDRLSKKTGKPYRLPSEAEWEYACRAGTRSPFAFGPTLTTDHANYRGESYREREGNGIVAGNYGKGVDGKYREQTTKVKNSSPGETPFFPNGAGLYDMHGNVWEWCQDNNHLNYDNAPKNGSAWFDQRADINSDRIIRGGSWAFSPQDCRSAYRGFIAPDSREGYLGFRVTLSLRPL